jgi:hypothetical protein
MKKTRKVLLGADKSKRFEIPFEVVNKKMSVLALPPPHIEGGGWR